MREARWHIRARWLCAAFLAACAIAARVRGHVESVVPLLVVSAGIAAYNVAFLRMAERDRLVGPRAAVACLLLDIVALTVYLHYSGDIENPLQGAYVLPVVAGSTLVSRRAGFLLASCGALLFGLLLLATLFDRFPVHLAHHHLSFVEGWELHARIDPDLNPGGEDFIGVRIGWLLVLLFGCAYGFGSLSDRVREQERALTRENVRMETLLATLPVGVVLIEADGRLARPNPTACALLGDIDGKPASSLDPAIELPARIAALGPSTETYETTVGDRVLEHGLALIRADRSAVWVVRDVTQQRRLLAQVMHHSKMADLGLLAAGIAHEIGNPLSSMSAILQLALMKGPAVEGAARLRLLATHLDRIHQIVRDITGFARPSAGRRTRVRISEMVEHALGIFRLHEKARKVQVDVRPTKEEIWVEVVEDQIMQVILNLLLNAADASAAGGTIVVEASSVEGEARLSVADQGSGITEEARRRLFTPFFTTKEPGQGVGLGLFVSESIMRVHGGRIEVSSSPGKGSSFVVCLPVGERKAA